MTTRDKTQQIYTELRTLLATHTHAEAVQMDPAPEPVSLRAVLAVMFYAVVVVGITLAWIGK